jgi:recombination protein RecA
MTNEEKSLVNKEKLKALQLTMDKIEKSYGKGSIMRMGDQAVDDVPSISSGSIALDVALGVGGYPKGRVIEIYDPNLQGKPRWPFTPLPKPKKPAALPR